MTRHVIPLVEDGLPSTEPWELVGYMVAPGVDPVPVWRNTERADDGLVVTFAPWDRPDVRYWSEAAVMTSPYFQFPSAVPEPPIPDILLNPPPEVFDRKRVLLRAGMVTDGWRTRGFGGR